MINTPDSAGFTRHLAVLRLRLPDGSVLQRQLLTLDAEDRVLSYRPLTEEVPFCPWYRGEWILR